jgi:hypothetical protein
MLGGLNSKGFSKCHILGLRKEIWKIPQIQSLVSAKIYLVYNDGRAPHRISTAMEKLIRALASLRKTKPRIQMKGPAGFSRIKSLRSSSRIACHHSLKKGTRE